MNKQMKEDIKTISNNLAFITLNRVFVQKNMKLITEICNELVGNAASKGVHKRILLSITRVVGSNYFNTIDDMTLSEYKIAKDAVQNMKEYSTNFCAAVMQLLYGNNIDAMMEDTCDPEKLIREINKLYDKICLCNNKISILKFKDRIRVRKLFKKKVKNYLPTRKKGPEDIGCTNDSMLYITTLNKKVDTFMEKYLK